MGVQPLRLLAALGAQADPDIPLVELRRDQDGQAVRKARSGLSPERLAGDVGGRLHLEESEVFEGAGDLVQRHLVGAAGASAGTSTCSRGSSSARARPTPARRRGGPRRGGCGPGQIGDVAVEPELRVGIDGEPALGQPGLALLRAADIDALRHVALGTDPAAAEDQLGERRALVVQHPQQQRGAAGVAGIVDAEPGMLAGIGGAGLGQPQLGQADQHLPQLLGTDGVLPLSAGTQASPWRVRTSAAIRLADLDPLGGLQPLGEAGEGEAAGGEYPAGRRRAASAAGRRRPRRRRRHRGGGGCGGSCRRPPVRPAPRRGGGCGPRRGRWRRPSAAPGRARC